MEIVFVLGAAFFVFLLFFLVFAIKRRETDEPVRIHNCQNCGCANKETGHLERFRRQAREDCDRRPVPGAAPIREQSGNPS